MKTGIVLACILISLPVLGQQNVLDNYTPESLKQVIEKSPKVILMDFEPGSEIKIRIRSDDVTEAEVVKAVGKAPEGKGLLRIALDENGDGKPRGTPLFELYLDKVVDFSKYRAVSFWMYVPPGKTDFFYGRHDIRLQLNEGKAMRTWPAVRAGWNWHVFDFSGLEDLPVVEKLRIRMGPLLEGFNKGDILFDQFELIPMEAADLESPSWAARYKGLEKLAEKEGLASLETVLEMCADESMAVRSLAVRSASILVDGKAREALPAIRKILKHPEWRARLAAINIIANIADSPEVQATDIYLEALLDENYYLRDFGYQHLIKGGWQDGDIAKRLVEKRFARPGMAVAVIRRLSEIGPGAQMALPHLMDVVRNPEKSHGERCWALRAIWEIDETQLEPVDWVLALDLNPGEIHYHLLNRAMDRLEQAGESSVPALAGCLGSDNAEVRARACTILGRLGSKAMPACADLKKALSDEWHVAWEADQALSKILPEHISIVTKPCTNPGSAADVEVRVSDTTTTISNGLVELVFKNGDQSPGPYSVRKPGGINLFEADWLDTILAFKHSKAPNMIERQWLQRLFGSPFSRDVSTGIDRATKDLVDYKILFKGNETAPIEFEYHIVVRRGQSGFYTYMITRNVSGEPLPGGEKHAAQIGVGRFNFLVALTQGGFDYLFLHDKLKGPAAFTEILQEPIIEGYPDIYQSAYRLPSGDVGAKHEWENYELFSEVNGYTSEENGGVWLITPSHDFMGDSMPRFIKRPCYGLLFIPHLQGKYHIQTGTRVTADWEKYYGPMFFYLNDGSDHEAMWVDAKREAAEQVAQWPYNWLEDEAYHDRGTLEGTLGITDGTSPEGSYVVLVNPAEAGDPDQYGVWMRNVGPYSYWTQVGPDGTFEIPDIHQGRYQMFAFKPGVYGEAGPRVVEITEGNVTAVEKVLIEPVENGELLWRIGIPDGMAMEFKNGRNYHQWDNYIRYRKDFPDDVHYVVGESDWSRDWNYIHPAVVQGETASTSWKISFDMQAVPDTGALLSIMCSGRKANARILLNGEPLGDLVVDIGSHHARTAPVGETVCRKYRILPGQLVEGQNTLELTFIKPGRKAETQVSQNWTSWLCYDFLQLEVLEPESRR